MSVCVDRTQNLAAELIFVFRRDSDTPPCDPIADAEEVSINRKRAWVKDDLSQKQRYRN